MALESDQLSPLSNPLATVEQLSSSSSQLDGVPPDLESSLRFAGAQLTQAAGILLRLPQEIIAQAIIIFYRFYVGSEGGSFRINAVKVELIANDLEYQHPSLTTGPGCLCRIAVHDCESVFPSTIDTLSIERLRLSHILPFSPRTIVNDI